MKNAIITLILLCISASLPETHSAEHLKPNIVYILCDDLGYGDVHCLNPQRGKIATPQLDRMASQGMPFTDAHTSSSVCTPTRYGIMTGRYNWRTHLQSGVLHGFSEPLIAKDRLTAPHTPIVPSKEWQGKSGLGKYGDFVMEPDWAVGEVLAALGKAGVGGNTLVI